MQTHGQGPKDVLVRRYRRWRRGKIEWVRDAFRSAWHPLSLRPSVDQFEFTFG